MLTSEIAVDLERDDWEAKPPRESRRAGRVDHVEVHHTVNPTIAKMIARGYSPSFVMQLIQRGHLGQRWNDIFYNIFVFPDGTTARGRVDVVNPGALAVCFLGNFEHESPTAAQVATLKRLRALFPEAELDTHTWRAAGTKFASACPGDAMIAIVTALNQQEIPMSDFQSERFVTQMYELLNRQPDEGGYAFWVQQLDDGERQPIEVLIEFLLVKAAADEAKLAAVQAKVTNGPGGPDIDTVAEQAYRMFLDDLASLR